MRSTQNERGSALLITMVMLLALGFIGAALILSGATSLRTAGEDRRGVQAQFAAEAGVKEALHRLALAPGSNVTVNGVTFDPAIEDTSSPLDPDWQANVYLPSGTTPASSDPSVVYTPTVQASSGALDYLRSGGRLSIQHKWRDRNGDGVRDADELVRYDAAKLPPENFDTGSSVEVIEVNGYRGDSRRRLRVEATRFPFTPNVLAAITSDRGVDVRGNVSICGHDHLATTPEGTDLETSPACSPTYDAASGHQPAIRTTGDDVDRRGSSDLNGYPAATDTSSSNTFGSLADALGVTQDVVDQLLANADNTSVVDPMDGITYITGDAHINNGSGSGLLYVTGDLHTTGNFVWRGLIYVEGDFSITGTPWILGGVMVRGHSDYAFSGGSPAILYSSETIRLMLEQSFDYVVLSWKEL